jgi:very-short-patch-repair endonuclease
MTDSRVAEGAGGPVPPEIERAKQVFRFLKAFVERNLPLQRRLAEQPWVLVFADLPRYPSIAIGEVQLAATDNSGNGADEAREVQPLLRVRRPTITRAPRPPTELTEWLRPGWEDPDGRVEVLPERNERRDADTVTVAFDEAPERSAAREEWQAAWNRWAEAERPVRATMRVFERLYELKGKIDLESERVELVLGDGRLAWQGPEGSIDHPVLLQRVELEFDPAVPEFRVIDADRPPELYGALLQGGEGMTAQKLNELRVELEAGAYHPLAQQDTSGYLRRLVALLSPHGTFQEERAPLTAGPDPVIQRDPALFLRTRLSGFPAAFDRVLEDLEAKQELPVSLTTLVGVRPPATGGERAPAGSPWSEPPDVLLSKPANPEQIAIARALDRHRAVLVQGPPGTGKSHTIANLIGHLVAHGKRVLVTSHTTKALRVLRAQVVEALRPLCVAVLEHDLEARTQMEQSVRGILGRLTTASEEALGREVAGLAETRAELIADIERITADLRAAREAEYLPIVVAGESVAPADAARSVRDHRAGNDWIPSPVQTGAPLPLEPEEITDLYRSSAALTEWEEREIQGDLPDAALLPNPVDFAQIVAALDQEEPEELAAFWTGPSRAADLPGLDQLVAAVEKAAGALARLEPWQRSVVAAGHTGGSERDLWHTLRDQVREAAVRWDEARPVLLDHDVELNDSLGPEGVGVVETIAAHLGAGGNLGPFALLFKRKWKAVIRTCRVNGQPPSKVVEFRAIGIQLGLDEGRRKLDVRWTRQAEPAGLPALASIGATPEPIVKEYAEQFDGLLDWWRLHWSAIATAAEQTGFRWDRFRDREVARSTPATPFERDAAILAGPLRSVVRMRAGAVLRQQALERLGDLERVLDRFSGPVCAAVLAAVRARDTDAYDPAWTALRQLAAKRAAWLRRKALLERLAAAAPGWAGAIRHRGGVHGATAVPGEPRAAWRWRQLAQEIDRRAALDEVALMLKLHQRRAELRGTTAQLIDRRAWLGQLRRIDLRARQALQGWADTQRRIGKGTGKRVPELQARARELLAQARDAVPVWIMPLARVAESFDPRRGRFDVVIVDEASQSDVTGLLAWYLGESIAVVGDHEQVSPLGVGQQIETIKALIAEHLGGIPNSHLYDGLTSIYDLARQCFGGTIALREHFRCVPDIIEFSNRLSYDGEIRPLRDPGSATRPHVVEYVVDTVDGSGREGRVNRTEARTIAALVKAATELPEYAGKTIGAITLLGDEQAALIQDLTVRLVGAVELDHRRFVAGNSAQFQGDERHVVFLSMVDSPTGSPLPLRQIPLFKQRYNVAASRAKDQLWLVHSLDPSRDLRAGDLRRVLIEHVRDPAAKRQAIQDAQRRAESPFETAIIERLINAGYRVTAQVWVGQYRLDMVVSDGDAHVALECDGDRWHGVDEIPADMARQAVLERAGWRFIRLRSTRFYRDPNGAMKCVFEELGRLGIAPAGAAASPPDADQLVKAFRKRVIKRAWEIMRDQDWLPPTTADA